MSRRDVSGLDPRNRRGGRKADGGDAEDAEETPSRGHTLPPPAARTTSTPTPTPAGPRQQPDDPGDLSHSRAAPAATARRRISVTLPVDVRRRLADRAHHERITHSQLVLEAVDAHPRPARAETAATGGRLAPPRQTRDTEGMVATTLYIDDDRLAELDRLVAEAGMTRSELVRRALQEHLSQ